VVGGDDVALLIVKELLLHELQPLGRVGSHHIGDDLGAARVHPNVSRDLGRKEL
jgi:hypothetical protein